MKLELVDNKKLLSNLVFKHLKKDLVATNCYLSIKSVEEEIDSKTIFYKEFSTGNLYILKCREDFIVLYYYINDLEKVEVEFDEIKSATKNSKVVVEIPYKEEPKDVLDLFIKLGFKVGLNRIKLECKNDKSLDAKCSYSELEWKEMSASIEDVDKISEFLLDNFNKYTGCIPLKAVIANRISSNGFYILSEKITQKIVGILEFDLGKEAIIKHLAVSKEYRNKGLGKLLINRILNTYNNVNVWTTFESKAEHFYNMNGFNETEYKSVVLIYGEVL